MTRSAVVVGLNRRLLTSLARSGRYRVLLVEEPDLVISKSAVEVAAGISTDIEVAPVPYQQVSTPETLLAALPTRPDVVVPGQEYAVPATAALAEAYGLPGASSRAAACLTDKLTMRAATTAAGMSAPAWREIGCPSDLRAFARRHPSLVVKPANRQGSVGVQLLDPGDDTAAAWAACVTASDPGQLACRTMQWRYLAESRLDGPETSTEALVVEGDLVFVNVTDKHVVPGRRPVELGHDVASTIPAARFTGHLRRLVDAAGFGSGILHAEWKLPPDAQDPVLIECAARTPGDSIMTLIAHAYGFDPYLALTDLLAGEPIDLPTEPTAGAAIRFLTAEPGRFSRLVGQEDAERGPGRPEVTRLADPGDDFAGATSTWDRVAQVVCRGPDGPTAGRDAERAVSRLDAVYEPRVRSTA